MTFAEAGSAMLTRLLRLPPIPEATAKLALAIDAAEPPETIDRVRAAVLADLSGRTSNPAPHQPGLAGSSKNGALGSPDLRTPDSLLVLALDTALAPEGERTPFARTVWNHALATAALGRAIAPTFGARPGRCFVGGLVQYLGPLLLGVHDAARAVALDEALDAGTPVQEAEKRVFGVRGSTLSSWAARLVGLPPELCAFLYALDALDPEPAVEVELVRGASGLATLFGYPPYRQVTGPPLDPAFEAAIARRPSDLRTLSETAAIAVGAADSGADRGVVEQTRTTDRAFEALHGAHRRLARLHAAYERTHLALERRIEATRNFVRTFGSVTLGLDVDALTYSILESLLENFGTRVAFLVQGTPNAGRLTGIGAGLEARRGPAVVPLELAFPDLEAATAETLIGGDAALVSGSTSLRFLRDHFGNVRHAWMAPLLLRGSLGGVLGFVPEDSTTPEPGEFLKILATAASLGLENARLYAEVLAEATTDPLTGVASRRVILEVLENLCRRRAEDRGAFALLLVDLDSFKAVNDTLGHDAGDRYLRAVAEALRRGLRPTDRLGRLGGDEFLIVARDLGRDEGRDLATALIARIDEVSQDEPWRSVEARLGITIGVAHWDGGPTESANLLSVADAALYGGKQRGRHRVGMPMLPIAAR